MSFGIGGLMLMDTGGVDMDTFGGINLLKKLTELTGNVRFLRRGRDEIDCGMYILFFLNVFLLVSISAMFVSCMKIIMCDHFL